MSKVTFTFKVELINNDLPDDYPENITLRELAKMNYRNPRIPHVRDHVQLVIDWYKEEASNWPLYICFNNFEITYNSESDLFIGTFEESENVNKYEVEMGLETFVDFDDDGNYPVTIDGIDFLIGGRLIDFKIEKFKEIHNKSYENVMNDLKYI
jgi:hypothetical protein